jgi:hypothetical protein
LTTLKALRDWATAEELGRCFSSIWLSSIIKPFKKLFNASLYLFVTARQQLQTLQILKTIKRAMVVSLVYGKSESVQITIF